MLYFDQAKSVWICSVEPEEKFDHIQLMWDWESAALIIHRGYVQLFCLWNIFILTVANRFWICFGNTIYWNVNLLCGLLLVTMQMKHFPNDSALLENINVIHLATP